MANIVGKLCIALGCSIYCIEILDHPSTSIFEQEEEEEFTNWGPFGGEHELLVQSTELFSRYNFCLTRMGVMSTIRNFGQKWLFFQKS